MWVHFKSDNNTSTTYKGFKASFKAGTGMYEHRYGIKNFFDTLLG